MSSGDGHGQQGCRGRCVNCGFAFLASAPSPFCSADCKVTVIIRGGANFPRQQHLPQQRQAWRCYADAGALGLEEGPLQREARLGRRSFLHGGSASPGASGSSGSPSSVSSNSSKPVPVPAGRWRGGTQEATLAL